MTRQDAINLLIEYRQATRYANDAYNREFYRIENAILDAMTEHTATKIDREDLARYRFWRPDGR